MPSKTSTMTLVFPAACVPPHAPAPSASAAASATTAGSRPWRSLSPLFLKRLFVQRLPIHVRGRIQPEHAQHRRRNVDERRVLAVDLPAREEHAGHEARIDAVV